MSKVSVITITFNSANFVRLAIESVLSQSYTDFEYIICDDCSTDKTWQIIQEYKDERIKSFRNDENIGEYPNRNKTLSFANGKFVIWIDGDDVFYPNGLEYMVKMLEAFPESSMACARLYWPNMIYPYEATPVETARFDYLASPITVNGFPDTLFKTDILRKFGGFPINFISGDTFIKRKIALNTNILLISQAVSWWRRRENQASSKLNSMHGVVNTYIASRELLKEAKKLLSDKEFEVAKKKLKKAFVKTLVKTFLKEKRIFEFLRTLKKNNISLFEFLSFLKKDIPSEFEKRINEKFYILPFNKNPYSINYADK